MYCCVDRFRLVLANHFHQTTETNMTATRCERQGQIELGIIEHEGREFVALGATVIGRHVTGYTKNDCNIQLTTWCGSTMLDCRSEIIENYWNGAMAIVFRLTSGRFIVGYALGDDGMLFRGELIDYSNDDQAKEKARQIAIYFSDLDVEDDEAYQAELAKEELDIQANAIR